MNFQDNQIFPAALRFVYFGPEILSNFSMKLKQDLDVSKITLIPHNSSRLLTLWECSLSDNSVLICGPCCICPSSLETVLSLGTACLIISYQVFFLKKKTTNPKPHTFKKSSLISFLIQKGAPND